MTATFRSRRSRIHLVLVGVVGLVLLYGALDILAGHVIDDVGQTLFNNPEGEYRISTSPAVDDDGNLTTRGQAQRRLDLVWGSLFIVAGVGLLVVSIKGLVDGLPIAEIDEDGIRLRMLGPKRYQLIPWQDISNIRSAREPGNGGRSRPVLLIAVDHPQWYPAEVWGAEWTGDWLRVDADQWVDSAEEFVVRADIELDRLRRVGPPTDETFA